MYFKFPCTTCGKNLKAREEHIGRKVGCPYCKAAVTVPEPPPAESDVAAGDGASDNLAVKSSISATVARRNASSGVTSLSGQRRVDGTNVSLFTTFLIGLVATIVVYVLLFPIQHTYLGQLFIHRGWIPYAETFFTCWSVAILFLKYRKLNRQRRSMLFDLLPTEFSEEITIGTLDKFTAHIRGLPGEAGESFLINRVLRGLEHFGVRKNAPEVASILASQSEIDAGSVFSSYSMLKVFIWAIPILGFIGTVIGISEAVGGFSGAMDKADDMAVIKESLNSVTGGLSTAFDTTLLALLMSMLIKFPTSSMQKSEEDMLSWVDEYCNENLLKRLNDGRDGGAERGSGGGRSAIQQAVDQAMREHHVELRAWTKRLETIGETLSNQVAEGWAKVNGQVASSWELVSSRHQEQQVKQLEDAQRIVAMAGNLQQTLNEVSRGLDSLNDVLISLGDRQIVVEAQPVPPRRGWLFWRSPVDEEVGVKRNGAP